MVMMAILDAQAMRVRAPGPPDVLKAEHITLDSPGDHDLVIRHMAIGLNYHDLYVRSGEYQTMPFPGIPGIEAAGIVEWAGCKVDDVQVGERIAYITNKYGAYATRRVLPASAVVHLPRSISWEAAAAVLLKGLTADMLLSRLQRGNSHPLVVVHAAAGGVGQIVVQMALANGAKVVGVVGNEAKARKVRDLGCDHVVIHGSGDLPEIVKRTGDGVGADMVFDGVGAATFEDSLSCLKPFGHLALFGQASGPVPPILPARLAQASLSVWRPVVFHYVAEPWRYKAAAKRLFEMLGRREIEVPAPTVHPLSQAALAHELLASRATSGATVFLP